LCDERICDVCSEPEVWEHLRNVYAVTGLAVIATAAGTQLTVLEDVRLVSNQIR